MGYKKLNTSLEFVKGVGPIRSKILNQELKLKTCKDILYFFPFRYVDRSKFYKISEINSETSYVQITGKITDVKLVRYNKGFRVEAIFDDGENELKLAWFKGTNWIQKILKTNIQYVIYGKVSWFNNKPTLVHPEIEKTNKIQKQVSINIKPIYHSTEKLTNSGITNNILIKIIKSVFDLIADDLHENLNESLNKKYEFRSTKKSLYLIHFPQNLNQLDEVKEKIIYEEFFFSQLKFNLSKNNRKTNNRGFYFPKVGNLFNNFYNNYLDFELTSAQKRVLKEIKIDFSSKTQMNRLLQGDVGSGKTIIAYMSILISIDNGFQSSVVSPTEILAQQHYQSFKEYSKNFSINVEILTGSTSKSKRKEILNKCMNGDIDILIGTHALFEEDVMFNNLGYVVIDEQHKFGVKQRSAMWKKNNPPPHVLIMSATPIPRTLTMSLYGDLDLSVIDELPPGRKKVITVHRYDKNRLKVYGFLKDQIKDGKQIYIVYPLIEESQKMDYKDLEDGYHSIIREFPLEQFSIGVLHGRMKNSEKDYEMKRFVEGKINILISTTVIEVGVNVKNATVMIIESAERFGLSQLHQLRGRVGRGSDESYCILMTKDEISDESKHRINAMTMTNDGFKISEIDLKLRGPGDILGTRQSGDLDLKIADLVKDSKFFDNALSDVKELLKEDPLLLKNTNQNIKNYIINNTLNKSWNLIG